jgi:hypothetical protein
VSAVECLNKDLCIMQRSVMYEPIDYTVANPTCIINPVVSNTQLVVHHHELLPLCLERGITTKLRATRTHGYVDHRTTISSYNSKFLQPLSCLCHVSVGLKRPPKCYCTIHVPSVVLAPRADRPGEFKKIFLRACRIGLPGDAMRVEFLCY